MPLTAVIVDDEPLARAGIRMKLQKHTDCSIVAECSNGYEAVEAIQTHKPDLLFLDIQMPEINGFGVLRALEDTELPHVIFISAFDEYAVQAFRVHAVDYLLKPVDPAEFDVALDRARQRIASKSDGDLNLEALASAYAKAIRSEAPAYVKRLSVRRGGRIVFLKTEDISAVTAADNYVKLHAQGREYLIRVTMNEVEQKLDPAQFVRVHRSAMVNLDKVAELRAQGGDDVVVMQDGSMHRVSRGYKDRLMNIGF